MSTAMAMERMSMPPISGMHLMMDMAQCFLDVKNYKQLKAFMDSVCGAQSLDIIHDFCDTIETNFCGIYILRQGWLSIRCTKNNRVIFDLLLEGNVNPVKMQQIKQGALDYFSPRLYRAAIRPRNCL